MPEYNQDDGFDNADNKHAPTHQDTKQVSYRLKEESLDWRYS